MRVAWLAGLAALVLAAPAAADVTPFTATYEAQYIDYSGSTCTTPMPLTGMDPGGTGRPVFIYLVGAGEAYDGAEAPGILAAAADKGFLAASVDYPQWQFYAAGIDGSSRCIFDGVLPGSAVAKLCAMPSADCRRGILVGGFSQGSSIALRAGNHDWRVRGAYLLGNAEQRDLEDGLRWQLAAAPPSGTRALPGSALRIVDGVTDVPSDRRDELDDMTGTACDTAAFDCLAADGSGWYVVQNDQVANGLADHCFFMGGGPYTSCTPTPPFDPTWLNSTTEPWALHPALDWLATRPAVLPEPTPTPTPSPAPTETPAATPTPTPTPAPAPGCTRRASAVLTVAVPHGAKLRRVRAYVGARRVGSSTRRKVRVDLRRATARRVTIKLQLTLSKRGRTLHRTARVRVATCR